MQLVQLEQNLLLKKNELTEAYHLCDEKILLYTNALFNAPFWQIYEKTRYRNLIETEKMKQKDLGFFLKIVIDLLKVLLNSENASMSLSDLLLVLSMLTDVLSAQDMLQVFGFVATRTDFVDFIHLFAANGVALSYIDEEDFKRRLDTLLGIDPRFLNERKELVIAFLCQAMHEQNQCFLDFLTQDEKDTVVNYLGTFQHQSPVEVDFILFCSSVRMCMKNPSNPFYVPLKDTCFGLFKEHFIQEKKALVERARKNKQER